MNVGRVVRLPAGTRGFDCNAPVDSEGARAFWQHGYRFAVRYVRRREAHTYDLSVGEIGRLLDAGLALMVVQHVESEAAWKPNGIVGREYGTTAAAACRELGIPSGVTVWCDLEGVAPGVDPTEVASYCQAWYGAVRGADYQPGLYVGWHAGLSAESLYHHLSFQRYWAAYNLNRDQEPAVRGVQMRQHAAKPGDTPANNPFAIDTDTVDADRFGGLPTAFAPIGWAP